MANIVVCYKLAPDAQDIKVLPDSSISVDRAEWIIGEYDLRAVEAGAQLAEITGGTCSALSIGPSQLNSSKARKDILSRGPNDLYTVVDDSLTVSDSRRTAKVLAAAIRKRGPFDLVICGEGSSDLYAQQVGLQLGEILGVAVTNSVSKIELKEDALIVERSLENEVEVLELPLPSVVSVTADMNLPRIPTMKDILAGAKKPFTTWSLADVRDDSKNSVAYVSTTAPKQVDRKLVVLESDSEENVQKFIGYLIKEGVFPAR